MATIKKTSPKTKAVPLPSPKPLSGVKYVVVEMSKSPKVVFFAPNRDAARAFLTNNKDSKKPIKLAKANYVIAL